MSNIKVLFAKNSTNEISVFVELDTEQQPIRVTDPSGAIIYEIVGNLQRHRLLTIRNPTDRVLFSIFYGQVVEKISK